jgi:hypothetical protein
VFLSHSLQEAHKVPYGLAGASIEFDRNLNAERPRQLYYGRDMATTTTHRVSAYLEQPFKIGYCGKLLPCPLLSPRLVAQSHPSPGVLGVMA